MSDEATTKQNEQPRGSGRDVVKLVAEDFIALPRIFPGRGFETLYTWARSIAYELKSHILHEAGADGVSSHDVAIDLEARAKLGEIKYGERLRAFNGRNAKVDAYQEALDLCNYLRQVLEELEIKK